MFTNGFIKIAGQVIEMQQTAPGVYAPKIKPKLNKLVAGVLAGGAAGGLAAHMYRKRHKKTASDMRMGPPKGKKETPEEKKIREQAEMTSLGC